MTALLMMSPDTYELQFDARRRERLGRLTGLTVQTPVADVLDLDPELLRGTDIVLTGWGTPRLDAARLDRLPSLRAVVHCAGSVKDIVTPELYARGVRVSSAAEANAIPVAEFTVAAIVMAGKKVPFLGMDARTYREDWSYRSARGRLSNLGLTVGIIGFSRVGRRVVERLQVLQDVTVLVSDPFADATAVEAAGGRLVDLYELLPLVDVLSIHAPNLPSTYHLVGAPELALLPDFATVINTARGKLVDTAALEAECVTGRLHAMLDVTDPEPLPASSRLYDLPNVLLTPHVAGSLDTEIRRMTDAALDEVERLRQGLPLTQEVTEKALVLSA